MSDFPIESGDGFTGVTLQSLDPRLGIGAYLAGAGVTETTSVPNTWPAANRALFVPILVPRSLTLVKAFVQNVTPSGNFDVGFYDAAGNRLVSSGSTAGSGASAVQVVDTTDTPVNPGRYYLAMSTDNATATFAGFGPVATILGGGGMLQMAAAFPLPATATFAAMASAIIPIFGFTTRVVV